MLICMASSDKVVAVNGNTAAPGLATPEAYQARGLSQVPDEGILASGVPATLSALLTALAQFGRLSFAEVVAPALDYAKNSFVVHTGLYAQEDFLHRMTAL
jgi:gamma-glutamyltranspeptidase/glutathione hydrolase